MESPVIRLQLNDPAYSYVDDEGKRFICSFTDAMNEMGYECKQKIVDGICYGKHMMIFTKTNAKSPKVFARLYFRTRGVVLRFFFNQVSDHAEYIDACPSYIKDTFIGDHSNCNHCRGDVCKFRKSYAIAGKTYEKCNGLTFEFFEPTVERLGAYMGLFLEFYPNKRKTA